MKLLLLFLLTFSHLFSAPALNVKREYKQADGTTFQARSFGNQHLNWIETEDGEVLKYNHKNKNFEYATIKDNNLKASGAKYNKSNSKKARSLFNINKMDKKELHNLWSKRKKESNERRGKPHGH